MRGLSKSKILNGLQCPKRLYLEVHRPELAETEASMLRNFARGHEVGSVAQSLHPGGVLIDTGRDLSAALSETNRLLNDKARTPIFEATFAHDGILSRADILLPGDGDLELIEVKASLKVKDHYVDDCAVQAWTIEQSGHRLKAVQLAHINGDFVYQREGDYEGLLQYEDLTGQVRDRQADIPAWISKLRRILDEPEVPKIEPGKQCSEPNACPFMAYCCPAQSDYPVSTLPWGGKVVEALQAEGIKDIREIPAGRLKNPVHELMRRAILAGGPLVEPDAAKILNALPYPRYFLDFETIQFAVPRWLGTRPYEQLPFQWSCHVERAGSLDHLEFLDVTGSPPMRAFAEALVSALSEPGPILVYNAGFEKRILREQAERFPDLAPTLEVLINRVIDLLPITRNCYYHPAMQGSWSIKHVLPTIAPELDYGSLDDVRDGGDAQEAFLECIDGATTRARRQELEGALRSYCRLDTLAMVRLARRLSQSPHVVDPD